jgi:hypothetical protein
MHCFDNIVILFASRYNRIENNCKRELPLLAKFELTFSNVEKCFRHFLIFNMKRFCYNNITNIYFVFRYIIISKLFSHSQQLKTLTQIFLQSA